MVCDENPYDAKLIDFRNSTKYNHKKKEKKFFFLKKKYMKNSKPNSLVLSYGRLWERNEVVVKELLWKKFGQYEINH